MQISEKDREIVDIYAKMYIRIYLENHVLMSSADLAGEQLINQALDFAILYINKRNSRFK